MGMIDKAKEMAQKARHSGKADEMVDKGMDKAKDMTGHKHDDKMDQGTQMAKGTGSSQQNER
jgi:hypothetical protein